MRRQVATFTESAARQISAGSGDGLAVFQNVALFTSSKRSPPLSRKSVRASRLRAAARLTNSWNAFHYDPDEPLHLVPKEDKK